MAVTGLDAVVMSQRGALRPDRAESSNAFREDRGRFRQRLRIVLLVVACCAFGMVRIWLSTEAATQGSRITGLLAENKMLANDLTVDRARLDQRRMYGALLVPAERAGFCAATERHTLRVESSPAAPAPGLWAQLGDEMRRGSQLVMTTAFAQGRRDARPRVDGARP
jgi:hypothetical protein